MQVGPACIVGDNSSLGDKCSVKRCVIGSNCRLGANVKVINCVVMDGVTVGDGCHLQNTIVCSGAVVQDKCTLKDCQVGLWGWGRDGGAGIQGGLCDNIVCSKNMAGR